LSLARENHRAGGDGVGDGPSSSGGCCEGPGVGAPGLGDGVQNGAMHGSVGSTNGGLVVVVVGGGGAVVDGGCSWVRGTSV